MAFRDKFKCKPAASDGTSRVYFYAKPLVERRQDDYRISISWNRDRSRLDRENYPAIENKYLAARSEIN